MDAMDQLMQYRQQGFFCSQILILQGLEQMGRAQRGQPGAPGRRGFWGVPSRPGRVRRAR